jgi:two-component system, OmpR family, phosphate regulon sensor histidine kinase PhoR
VPARLAWKLGLVCAVLILGVFVALHFRQAVFAVSLSAVLIGIVLTVLLAKSFSRRIDRLTNFSNRIARGDFQPLPAENVSDEVSGLADAMNAMAASIDRTIGSLSGERNRSGAILRSMVEGVAVVDAHEKLVFSNRAFSEILNLDTSAIEGRFLIEVIRHTDLLGLIRRALLGEEGLQTDIGMGIVQQRSFSVTATPVRALETGLSISHEPVSGGAAQFDAKPTGAVVVLHDVTELRRLERVRQDFVANVSHEFKTPLTAIQGFAETLLAGALDDPQNNRRFLEIIREHAARLARLTDDLLKLARIEAGKLELEFVPVDLEDQIDRCLETSSLKANWKHIALETDIPDKVPPAFGDASLVHEVIQNLLDNAIQYTPKGGRITVRAVASDHEAIVTVSDTGIGIPLADQERIFERFYRVDAARSREAGGTGLGLSIAKHIVETQGGRLWVHSEVGVGSSFSFSIPLASG